ncbi:MAG: hypothetical protein ACW99A_23375 [Candidatus Kariarchaeaceae archaeon]|jgi:hypothetical protein
MSVNSKQDKFGPIVSLVGLMMIMISFIIGAFILAPTANSYFGDNTKATRDDAASGSSLLDDLSQLNSTPKWLEPFVFLGIATMMFGIALLFSTIPALLKQRGTAMKAAFPKIVGGNK